MSVLLVFLFEETVGAQEHLALAVSSKHISQSQSTYLGALRLDQIRQSSHVPKRKDGFAVAEYGVSILCKHHTMQLLYQNTMHRTILIQPKPPLSSAALCAILFRNANVHQCVSPYEWG